MVLVDTNVLPDLFTDDRTWRGWSEEATRDRAGGQRAAPLPDCYIGAHAPAQGRTLLTRDPNRYRDYFPHIRLIAPTGS